MKLLNLVLVSAFLLFTINSVSAQSKKKYKLEIKKIQIRNDLQSPRFDDRIDDKKAGVTKKWVVLMVDYKVDYGPGNPATPKGELDNGRWLDSVEAKWEFLYKPKAARPIIQNYIRFGKTVKYKNVGHGEHTALLFISPIILERYFNKGSASLKNELIIRFSLKTDGHLASFKIGTETQKQAVSVNGKFTRLNDKERQKYTRSDAFNNDQSKPLSNVLLRRDETPFRSMQFDMFDSIAVDKEK